jgi:hypothetical protein
MHFMDEGTSKRIASMLAEELSPTDVRVQRAKAREYDAQFSTDSYSYTTIKHLKRIMESDKNKPLLGAHLPKSVVKNQNNINAFLNDINRLNSIRNQVMHPVREEPPTENDFLFVRELHGKLCFGS